MRGGSASPYPPFQHNSISRFILQARSYLVRPPEFPRRPRIIRHLPSYNNGTEGLVPPPPPPARECQSTGIGWYFQQLCNFLGIVGSSRELLLYLPTYHSYRPRARIREGRMAETIHYHATCSNTYSSLVRLYYSLSTRILRPRISDYPSKETYRGGLKRYNIIW